MCSVKKQLPCSNTFLPWPFLTNFVGQDVKGKSVFENLEGT